MKKLKLEGVRTGIFYGGQSKIPEHVCSNIDVTGFPNHIVPSNT